jgi:hypothetical protein
LSGSFAGVLAHLFAGAASGRPTVRAGQDNRPVLDGSCLAVILARRVERIGILAEFVAPHLAAA